MTVMTTHTVHVKKARTVMWVPVDYVQRIQTVMVAFVSMVCALDRVNMNVQVATFVTKKLLLAVFADRKAVPIKKAFAMMDGAANIPRRTGMFAPKAQQGVRVTQPLAMQMQETPCLLFLVSAC